MHEFDVFFCHASEDKPSVVDPLAAACQAAGVRVWMDAGQIGWGDEIAAKINEGLSKSEFVLVVFSEAFHGKLEGWPGRELSAAIHLEASERRNRVLPLIIGDVAEMTKVIKRKLPLIAGKLYEVWDDNPDDIANAIVRRLGNPEQASPIKEDRLRDQSDVYLPKKTLVLTDQLRDEFLASAFETIRDYFDRGLRALEQHDSALRARMTQPTSQDFRCKIYRDGKSVAECRIWLDDMMGSPGIFFSEAMGIMAGENAHNEMLRVELENGELSLTGWAAGFGAYSIEAASPKYAAEQLWKRFLQPLGYRQ
jgi:hypothetical protein